MKALPEKILDIIQQLPEGEVLTPSRFLHHGSRHAVQRGLSRLVEGGKLFRVARGIYVAAVETRFGVRPPAPEKVVHSLANALGEVLVDHGARAANKLGLSTQVPVRYVFLTDGRSRELQVGKTTVSIRYAPRWLMALGATGAGKPFEHWIGLARQAWGMPFSNFINYYPRANGVIWCQLTARYLSGWRMQSALSRVAPTLSSWASGLAVAYLPPDRHHLEWGNWM